MQSFKDHWQLILVTVFVFLFWNSLLVLPLKIMVVFMHELSHGLAAVITGGAIESISLSISQGGHAITRGGNVFVILSAGYIGSLLIGMALFVIALRTDADRVVMALFGAMTLLVAALYISDVFPLIFCTVTGFGMLAIAWYLDHATNDMVLRIIGLTSLIYVPYDIFDDTIARPGVRSDAAMLSEQFGGPTMVWGGLWLVLSLAVIGFCLRYGLRRSSNLSFGRMMPLREEE